MTVCRETCARSPRNWLRRLRQCLSLDGMGTDPGGREPVPAHDLPDVVCFGVSPIGKMRVSSETTQASRLQKTMLACKIFDGSNVSTTAKHFRRIAEQYRKTGRDEMRIQSVHVVLFSHVSRVTRHDLWRWRPFQHPAKKGRRAQPRRIPHYEMFACIGSRL